MLDSLSRIEPVPFRTIVSPKEDRPADHRLEDYTVCDRPSVSGSISSLMMETATGGA
jgi:hypothetical protein